MEYTINKLANLAGLTNRTLRYYDEIGLLSPQRISSNGYRIYGQKEVDLLQQILFYRELGLQLDDIKQIVHSKDYDSMSALQDHLLALKAKKTQLDLLITTVEKTLAQKKGEIKMTDKEKFEGFKKQMIQENEKEYGAEIREKYGDKTIDESNAKMLELSPQEFTEMENLSLQINETLKLALEQGDPSSQLAQEVCELHRKWLGYSWPSYSKEAHLGLGQLYVEDPRFKAYYDAIKEGSAEFLYEALKIYCESDEVSG
ncbi:MerR family transcriptional regulator [Granulicatella seriolae]|uniref:MerR family transcriptional regulator n=1 Tax=Granulicatella seriolae TaxID=2967226 RepID=A0ABT1WP80_9LACT|nr:MerR family transcriptional regulator [Granulicatella seriolae]